MMKSGPPSHLLLSLLLIAPSIHGDYRDEIGWGRLAAELGHNLPAGRGIEVSQIESGIAGAYRPDTTNFEFSGKTFTPRSGESDVSNHATFVAQRFFGTHTSISPGIDTINLYEATDWLYGGYLCTRQPEAPIQAKGRVHLHSWTGSFETHADNIKAIRRLDHAIDRDSIVSVVALRNSRGDVPALLAHTYNAIVTGNSNGVHVGSTWFDEPGRSRPDIVAPEGAYFAPVVGSAAALLLEEADRTPALEGARHPYVIKSLLMAGATKHPFPDWSRSDEQPLDQRFGAGQIDVFNSYRILTSGQHLSESAPAPASGWRLGGIEAGETQSIPVSFADDLATFTANLAWHRLVEPPDNHDYLQSDVRLPRLELRLIAADGGGPAEEVQVSVDPLSNNQHLYMENLPAGAYTLQVDRTDEAPPLQAEYALAWNAIERQSVSAATFAEWRERVFSGAELEDVGVSGPDADPDADGIRNLLEYALGGSPHKRDRQLLPGFRIAVVDDDRYLALSFTRPDAPQDIRYEVDLSADLRTWSEAAGILLVSQENPDGTVTDTYRHPQAIDAHGAGFLRLRVVMEE